MRESIVAARIHKDGAVSVILLTWEFKQEDGQWLAECLELGTATHGNTLEEVRQELGEFVNLHLNQVEEMGFIDDYLKEHGVRLIPLVPSSQSAKNRQQAPTWKVPTPAGA